MDYFLCYIISDSFNQHNLRAETGPHLRMEKKTSKNVVSKLAKEEKVDVKPKVKGEKGSDEQRSNVTVENGVTILTRNGRRYKWSNVNGGQWVDLLDGSILPAGNKGDPINLKIMDPSGNYHNYMSSTNVMFDGVMKKFCQETNLDKQSIRFCFDGRRLKEEDTAKIVEMEEGDIIEVYQEQSGGQD